MGKIVYFLNDTRSYHGGSYAASTYFISLFESHGYKVIFEQGDKAAEKSIINECDIVFANGEGTLHRGKPRAIEILESLSYAKLIDKYTILANFSWFNMENELGEIVKCVDEICVRDPLSRKEVLNSTGRNPEIALDASYFFKDYQAKKYELRDNRFLRTDFYSAEFDCFCDPIGGSISKIEKIIMPQVDWHTTLKIVGDSRVFLCGRFHGLIAALKTRTRFILYPGNTPKIESIIRWFSEDAEKLFVLDNYSEAASRMRVAHRNENLYEEIFDWAKSQKPWIPSILR